MPPSSKLNTPAELVTSLVHEDDIVPRTSVRSLCAMLDRAANLPDNNKYLLLVRKLLPFKAALVGMLPVEGFMAGKAQAVPDFNPNYDAQVPGRVVFAYHTQSPAQLGVESCATSHTGQLALLGCTHPQVTKMRGGRRFWADHHMDCLILCDKAAS